MPLVIGFVDYNALGGFLAGSLVTGFALAIFCVRHGTPPEIPLRFLKPNPRQVFIDSLDYVADLERS